MTELLFEAVASFLLIVEAAVTFYTIRKRRMLRMIAALLDDRSSTRTRRKIWMHLRSNDWWQNASTNYSNSQWIEHFRLSHEAFAFVKSLVEDDMKPEDVTVRDPIPLEKRIAIAIYQLATSAEYRTTGNVFGVHKTSVHRYLLKFCHAICKKKERIIRMPSPTEAKALARDNFLRYGFPQVYGAIDGCHIHVKPPSMGRHDYVNRKMFPSMVLQAVVDQYYSFRDISIRMPGSVHDASVLRASELYKNSHLLPKEPISLRGAEIPLLILGDAAYPMTWYIMRPYVGTVTDAEECFNETHSKLRVVVENAFGRLKSRWRILQRQLDVNIGNGPYIIATCCVLHNICEDRHIPLPRDDDRELNQPPTLPQQRLVQDSQARRAIAEYLYETKNA